VSWQNNGNNPGPTQPGTTPLPNLLWAIYGDQLAKHADWFVEERGYLRLWRRRTRSPPVAATTRSYAATARMGSTPATATTWLSAAAATTPSSAASARTRSTATPTDLCQPAPRRADRRRPAAWRRQQRQDLRQFRRRQAWGDGNDDTLSGGTGYDWLYGGTGNDTVHGDADNDRLFGDQGDDVLFGDAGSDRVYGDVGKDTL